MSEEPKYKVGAELGNAIHDAQLQATRAQAELPIPELRDCARCGGVHTDLVAKRFTRVDGAGTHYMYCPENGEPIFVEIQIAHGEPNDLPGGATE
jgi:hypothetical protein